jgi:Ca2+-binding RTX toxin-like protein
MDYAVVYTAGGALSFYQNGSLQVASSVTAASGDKLNIHVNSGVVSVSVNGTTVHTFTKATTGAPLYADIALNTVGAAFNNIVMSDDAIAASANYAVDTELTLENVSVAANTLTVTYNSTLSALSTPPTDAFEVMVDGGGRPVTGTAINGNQLVLTFGGSAVTNTNQVEFSYTATGSNKVKDLYGGLADNLENVVAGNGNLNVLTGGVSNDFIVGTSGADVITGNAGNDLLLGKGGADTFDFNNVVGGNGTDTILEFNTAEGDKIDLSDVLVGYKTGDNLSDYIRVETYSDSDDRVVLKIDTDGVGDANSDPFNPNLTIILGNVTASDVNLATYLNDLNTGGSMILL